MVSVEDETTSTVSKDTREWLIMLKLEIQVAKKQKLAQDDIVRLALACLEQHKQEAEKTWTLSAYLVVGQHPTKECVGV